MFNISFSKIVPFTRKCGKILYRTERVTDDNMAHAHYILDTYYKYTHSSCATLVAFPQQ